MRENHQRRSVPRESESTFKPSETCLAFACAQRVPIEVLQSHYWCISMHIGLFLFKRTISLFFRPFFGPPPGSGLGAPGRPGIDSARSLDLLGIVGDDAGQVPTVLGPCTTPTRRSCPPGACHRALSGPAAAWSEIRKFARKIRFFSKNTVFQKT